MEVIKQHKKLAALFAASIVFSLLFRRSFPLYLFLVGMLVAYFPLKTSLSSSIVFRLTMAITSVMCLFQMEAMLFWAANIWVKPLTYLLTSIVVAGIGLWLINKRKGIATSVVKLGWLDIALLLPGLFVGGAYTFATLAPSTTDDVTIVRSIAYGMDDATHAIIFSDVLYHDSNILAGDKRSKLMNKSVHASYPMGWHVSTSIVTESFVGNQRRTPIKSIELYFYAKVITLVLAITSLTILIYALAARLWAKTTELITLIGVMGVSIFVTVLLLLPLFFDGFFSFLPIIAYTTLFATILIDTKPRTSEMITLTLLLAASALTWMLTAPILMAAFSIYYFYVYGSLKKLPRPFYASLAVGALFVLAQAYILYSANKNSLQNISNAGGIANPNHLLLAVCLVAFFYLWAKKDKVGEAISRPLFGIVGSFTAVLALLLLYLIIDQPEPTYYFYKLQVVLLVVLVPLVCTQLLGLLLHADSLKSRLSQIVALAVGFSLLVIAIPSIAGYDYVHTTVVRAHSHGITTADAQRIIKDSLGKPVSNNNQRTYFMFPNDAPRNILLSNLDKLSYRSVACDYDLFAADYNYDVKGMDKALNTCAPELPLVKIYTNKQGQKDLLKQLNPVLLTNHEVQLVVI